MLLRRVIYASHALPGLQDVELRQIFGFAGVLHRRGDLSGVLVYTSRHFVQAIEGTPVEVDRLLRLIAADSRHEGMRVLCDELIPAREFGSWHSVCLSSLDLVDEVEQIFTLETVGCPQAKAFIRRLLSTGTPDSQS